MGADARQSQWAVVSMFSGIRAWYGGLHDTGVLLLWCLVELVTGVVAVLWQCAGEKGTAFLWCGGWFWGGFLVGFIFAFPRTSRGPSQGQDASDAVQVQSDRKYDRAVNDVNTNLVEISDWLTKSIVGIGLIELKQLPTLGRRVAAFMASGLPSVKYSPSFAGAIIMYFGTIGFINGYHFTRVYTARVFRNADKLEQQVG